MKVFINRYLGTNPPYWFVSNDTEISYLHRNGSWEDNTGFSKDKKLINRNGGCFDSADEAEKFAILYGHVPVEGKDYGIKTETGF